LAAFFAQLKKGSSENVFAIDNVSLNIVDQIFVAPYENFTLKGFFVGLRDNNKIIIFQESFQV